ncbi:glycosyltransferase family 2 protein [Gorillibacterium sp. sgz500922]|uniref:glycosyltransferase family 2 protein n=1 Tax=Gorillibacterium sp. sgz500922 TaxID=3446694 RepID=UPI003F666D63
MDLVIVATRMDSGFGTEHAARRQGGFRRIVRLGPHAPGSRLQQLLADAGDGITVALAGTRPPVPIRAGSDAAELVLTQERVRELAFWEETLLNRLPVPEWLPSVLSELLSVEVPCAESSNWAGEAGLLSKERCPAVSVVICTCDDFAPLPWAVYSVLRQTCPSWELLLVDDGSSGEIPPPEWLSPDSRIRRFRFQPNRGKAHALNEALPYVRGKWLVELDPDDWLEPEALEVLLAASEVGTNGPPLQAIVADHRVWRLSSGSGWRPGGCSLPSAPLNWRTLLRDARVYAPRLFRTDLLRRIGGWPVFPDEPGGGRLYEDLHLLARLLRAGEPIAFVPKPLYHRRVRPESVSQRDKARYAAWRDWLTHRLEHE